MNTIKSLLPLAVRFLSYALVFFIISFINGLDFSLASFKEDSYTEISQETLLFVTSVLLAILAIKYRFMREFNAVLALFFLVHLIRELDGLFDILVYHGFWKVPVWIIVAFAFFYIFKNRKKYLNQLLYIQDKYPFGILLTGLLVLHVFSRLYGRSTNWQNLLQDEYVRVVKDASEESIELLAYSIVFIAVVEWVIHMRKQAKKDADLISS